MKFKTGTEVFWKDPTGENGNDCSGVYTVASDDGTTVLLRDTYGDISNEAFHHELSLVGLATVTISFTDGSEATWFMTDNVADMAAIELIEFIGQPDSIKA